MIWLALLGDALANGQTTHVWITLHALEHLEAGPLRDLLTREDLRPALVHGTMFPDGGYAIDVRDYGEASHWEPFQTTYREWIVANHPFPLDDEGAKHAAFFFGMASHGLADQTFDAMFMERSKHHDAAFGWSIDGNFDEATDVIWAQRTSPQVVPEIFVPFDQMLAISHEHGHAVTRDNLEDAQRFLRAAIEIVGIMSTRPELVADYEAEYPWAAVHLTDATIPGSPSCEGELVARYWEELYARMQGEAFVNGPLLGSFPEAGGFGHPTTSGPPESWVSLVFARSLRTEHVTVERFALRAADGVEVPFSVNLFYGNDSHVVHLKPSADLSLETDYEAVVRAGLPFTDGNVLTSEIVLPFSTRPPPPPPAMDDVVTVQRGCGGGESAFLFLPVLFLGGVRRRAR